MSGSRTLMLITEVITSYSFIWMCLWMHFDWESTVVFLKLAYVSAFPWRFRRFLHSLFFVCYYLEWKQSYAFSCLVLSLLAFKRNLTAGFLMVAYLFSQYLSRVAVKVLLLTMWSLTVMWWTTESCVHYVTSSKFQTRLSSAFILTKTGTSCIPLTISFNHWN